MRRAAPVSLALFLAVVSGVQGQEFAGTFTSTEGGGTTALTLTPRADGSFTGTVSGGGESAEVEAGLDGQLLEGTMNTVLGSVHFHAEFIGEALRVTLFQMDPSSNINHDVGQRVAFQRNGTTPAPQPPVDTRPDGAPPGERDVALVGRWVKEDTTVDPQMSLTTTMILELRPDGTFEQRSGRMAGGTAGVSIQGAESTDADRGYWRSEESQFYLMAPGTDRWALCCRYYVEGDRMLITQRDGDREIWHRRD